MLQKKQEKSWKQDQNKVAKKVGLLSFKKAAKNKQKNWKEIGKKNERKN